MVSLATPLAWHFIGFLLLAALAAAIVFLATASYSRVETVTGSVALDKGVAPIVPSRPGTVDLLQVREGQRIAAGAVLARVRSEEDLAGGSTAPERVRDALTKQDRRLAAQGDLLLQAADAESSQLRAQITGISSELASLEGQITDQQRLVQVATSDFREAQRVANRGFISRRDLDGREATLLSRRQQLAQIEQVRAGKRADLMQAQRAITHAAAAAQAQIAGAESSRAALLQQVVQADLASGYTLTAPVAGVVTALTARIGQPATPQQPLMTIVPERAIPRVELYVPTSAAGFLAPGQDVRIAVDAFPYQQFGTVVGKIKEISSVAITREGGDGPMPVYLVIADVAQPFVRTFSGRQPMLPGMTLTARIVTQKRSLLEWLFEPLLAVRNR